MVANTNGDVPELGAMVRLSQVADMLPRRPDGKKVSLVTLYRWIAKGCRGAKLQAWNLGGATYTTRGAVEQFIAETSQARGLGVDQPATRSPAKRTRDHERPNRA